jgi:hypothetical protein
MRIYWEDSLFFPKKGTFCVWIGLFGVLSRAGLRIFKFKFFNFSATVCQLSVRILVFFHVSLLTPYLLSRKFSAQFRLVTDSTPRLFDLA